MKGINCYFFQFPINFVFIAKKKLIEIKIDFENYTIIQLSPHLAPAL
jgi:hypothetical protein